MIRLAALFDRLDQAGLLRAAPVSFDITDLTIDHLANDSRKVGPGGLFVAVRGDQADGHLFIDKAVQNGAIAIVCEAMPVEWEDHAAGIALAHVINSRAALAELAAAFYGDPARHLHLIGVTGTNGKTTTAFLIHHLLSTLGVKAGLIGTVAYRIGDQDLEATHTTPDALDFHRLLRQMADAGCTACVMEVSSHALDQDRVRAAPFDVALFTNLTQDHLDYHATLGAYLKAKKKLFDGLYADATALYNADDPAGPKIVADTAARRVAYGQSTQADICVDVLANEITGLQLRLDGREQRFRLVGRFNAYNLAAAYGAGLALGYDADTVVDALADAPPVPGRFEQVNLGGAFTAIVDYAHTPDALENVLTTIREMMPEDAMLWCVFGCGGDRDRTKRPQMGAIVERRADRLVVTSDNPRTEPPMQIIEDIRTGLKRPDDALIIADRREAIREAIRRAMPGDVVLVAGKGHETYQIVGTEKRSFDDCAEVRKAFDLRKTSAV